MRNLISCRLHQIPKMTTMKNQRKPNWDDPSMQVLCDGVERRIATIKCKFSPSLTQEKKQSAWATVTACVNAVTFGCTRTVDEVKKRWQDAQSSVKKKEAQRLKAASATGGGPAPNISFKCWEKIVLRTMSPTSISGLEGGVDTAETQILESSMLSEQGSCAPPHENDNADAIAKRVLSPEVGKSRRANESYLRALSRYHADKKNILMSTEEANMESMKDMQSKLEHERASRQKAEQHCLDIEKRNSEMKVDLHQLNLRVSSLLTDRHMQSKYQHNAKSGNRANTADLKKKEMELRKLQQDLNMEREKYNKMVTKMQRDLSDSQQSVYEESQMRQKLQMELDSKDSEIEMLRQKLSVANIDAASINSGSMDETITEESQDSHMEGWLAIPNRSNIKKYGWNKKYVVVSSRKVLFYNNEVDKMNFTPSVILDIDKLFHVHPVTQGDVYRADAKDVPRIFQILYATEGESSMRKLDEEQNQDRMGIIPYKGHDFLPLQFRTPTTCDSCNKPVWHMLHPPPALECKRCHVKVHKDHFDLNEEFIAYCKVTYEASMQAKEMILLAESSEKQKSWVQHLSKKVSRKGIVSSGNISTLRGTKQYSSYGPQQRGSSKSATLPANPRS